MRIASLLLALGIVGAVAACSSAGGVATGNAGSSGSSDHKGGASGTKDSTEPEGGDGGDAGEGGEQSSEGGSGGDGNTAGSGGTTGDSFGGSGGSIELGGTGGTGETCAAVDQKATSIARPVDIIWAIDTSGSMDEEAAFVQAKLNAFAKGILDLGIDVRVVMLAEPQFCFLGFCPEGICIPAPLGSGSCPNDSKPPLFLHPDVEVASTDGLKVLIDSFPKWKQALRPDSLKMIIAVTDDDATSAPYAKSNFPDGATGAAQQFIQDFTALDPVLLKDWKVNGIYSFTNCQTAASIGETWDAVVNLTGGVKGDLCTQNFQPIFNDMAKAIVKESKLDCEWIIPPPPENQSFDPNQVNVLFTSGGGQQENIYYVDSASKCDAQKGGWYFDDASNPKRVIACPASCSYIQKDTEAQIDIQFGCTRIPLPIN